jgi:hypothetical protein
MGYTLTLITCGKAAFASLCAGLLALDLLGQFHSFSTEPWVSHQVLVKIQGFAAL